MELNLENEREREKERTVREEGRTRCRYGGTEEMLGQEEGAEREEGRKEQTKEYIEEDGKNMDQRVRNEE